MPVFAIKCPCGHKSQQYLKSTQTSLVVKCPHCLRGVTAKLIKTKGVVEAEADGVVGYLRYDNKRHFNR